MSTEIISQPITIPNKAAEGDPDYRSVVILEEHLHQVNQHVYFQSFEESSVLSNFYHMLQTIPPTSTVTIHLHNVGGSVETGIQLIHHIGLARERGVEIVVSVEGPTYSMGSLFVTKCMKLGIKIEFTHEPFYLMFHDYADGTYGKGHEIQAYNEASKKLLYKVFHDYADILFSHQEIDEILKGDDQYLYLNDSDPKKSIIKRFNKYNKDNKRKSKKRG